jgi:hypothetical protein
MKEMRPLRNADDLYQDGIGIVHVKLSGKIMLCHDVTVLVIDIFKSSDFVHIYSTLVHSKPFNLVTITRTRSL